MRVSGSTWRWRITRRARCARPAEQFNTLEAAQPGDTRVATLLADCYARLGQDSQAIAVLKPVEAAHPDDLAVAWLLGSALIRAGRQRDGLERVDRVARQGNRPEAYLLAGQTALKLNEFERARDYADAALRLNPQAARRGYFARHRADLHGRYPGRHRRAAEGRRG
jgi:tetratricopeptide (TPR) repeat protein